MNRCKSFGITLAVSLLSVCSAYGQGATATPSAAPKMESFRAVLSKVSSIGTNRYNSSVKAVSAKGVRLSAIVTGERWVQGSNGSFSATDKITQLNFILPSRMSGADTNTTLCLELFNALRASGSTKTKLELNFAGYRNGEGNYIVKDILGCGEIQQVTTLPVVKPTATPKPKPTATPTPKR